MQRCTDEGRACVRLFGGAHTLIADVFEDALVFDEAEATGAPCGAGGISAEGAVGGTDELNLARRGAVVAGFVEAIVGMPDDEACVFFAQFMLVPDVAHAIFVPGFLPCKLTGRMVCISYRVPQHVENGYGIIRGVVDGVVVGSVVVEDEGGCVGRRFCTIAERRVVGKQVFGFRTTEQILHHHADFAATGFARQFVFILNILKIEAVKAAQQVTQQNFGSRLQIGQRWPAFRCG